MIAANARAAWIPADVRGRSRTTAIDAAVAWVQEAADAGLDAVLLLPSGDWAAPTAFSAGFAEGALAITAASTRHRSPTEDGQAVLAFVDSYDDFTAAQRAAQASWRSDVIGAIAVIPSQPLLGLTGWARLRGATNLATGKVLANPVTASQIDLLDDLVTSLYSSGGMGRDGVARALRRLRERNDFDPEIVQGYVLAHSVPEARLRGLARLLEEG